MSYRWVHGLNYNQVNIGVNIERTASFLMYNTSVILQQCNINITFSVTSVCTCDRLNLSHEKWYLKFSLGGDPSDSKFNSLRDSFIVCVEVCI